MRQLLVVLALAGLLTAASAGPAQAAVAGSATGVSPVKATDASVTGYSRLAHGSGGVRFKLLTTRLQPGNAYTVWWVVLGLADASAEAIVTAASVRPRAARCRPQASGGRQGFMPGNG